MKKILYITNLSRAINVFCVPHIKMLKYKGFKVDCACYVDKTPDESLVDIGVRFFDIPFTRNPLNLKNFKAFKELVKIQKKEQYDIIHVHTPTAAVYGRLLKLYFKDLEVIYTAHGFHFYKGAPILNWIIYYPIEKILARFTDKLITINNEDYIISKKFNVDKTFYMSGVGIDFKKYNIDLFDKIEIRKKLNISTDTFVILMIADVNKNKNHAQLIKAIEYLKDEKLNIKVLCAGEGPLIEKINNYIKEKNIEDYIEMLGFRNDIEELIAACDIGVLMSYREGLPKNIMELMAYKKPVIGTDTRGIRDLIDDKKTGFIVPIDDSIATAEKIRLLYNDPNLRIKFGENAFEKIQDYNVDNILKELEAIY